MIKIDKSHIKATDEIKNLNTDELTDILLNSVIGHKELETRILEFNKDFQDTTFHDRLAFELRIAIMKYSSPNERMKWESGYRIPMIMMDEVNNDPYTSLIDCILNDFIRIESKKCMKRILIKKDILTGSGEILKDMSVFDYSIVDAHDQLKNYKSRLFEATNHDLIKYYYRNFIDYFPVTLTEFERTFFFFLTLLAEKQYPSYTDINDVYRYIGEINEILRMRYINLHDKVIMALVHLISDNPELHNTSENIFNEIKHIEDLTIEQFKNVSS